MPKHAPKTIIEQATDILTRADAVTAEFQHLIQLETESQREVDREIKEGRLDSMDTLNNLQHHRNRLEIIPHRKRLLEEAFSTHEEDAAALTTPVSALNRSLAREGERVIGARMAKKLAEFYPGNVTPPDKIFLLLEGSTASLRFNALAEGSPSAGKDGYLGSLRHLVDQYPLMLDALKKHDIPVPSAPAEVQNGD